jgi:chemotaxis protein methyltransferase CheR
LQLELTSAEFDNLRSAIRQATGIKLNDHKRSLVVARLARRLYELGLTSFSQYLSFLQGQGGKAEMVELVNAITTNTTQFFREPAHFEYLQNWLPEWRRDREQQRNRTLRVWSAACSSGQEPYTLAIVLSELFGEAAGWDIRILATDIDTNVLRKAHAGVYSEKELEGVPERRRQRCFVTSRDDRGAPIFRVRPFLRRMVIFRKLNLVYDEFRFKRPIDVIFCRNVMIYFDAETRAKILRKFFEIIHQDGRIFVGHSESLLGENQLFTYKEKTVYSKARSAPLDQGRAIRRDPASLPHGR